MKPELKERLARLGRIADTGRVPSGSPVGLVIRPAGKSLNSIEAIKLVATCGLPLLRAKRAVEGAMQHGTGYVQLPAVADLADLVGALGKAGFEATRLAREPVDVHAIRKQLGLSQEQFALRFNLDLDTVQNWEQGRCAPDRASNNYLRVIARQPDAAAGAQEVEIA